MRHGRVGRRGLWRPFGCLILLVALIATGTITLGVWALAALLGLVSAPPVVVAGGVIALFVLAAAALRVGRTVRQLTAPIDDLLDAAARIEAGDYSVRVAERGPAQLRSLGHAFNDMTSRLADIDSRRRTFLADVAHELRTPLTVIEGQLAAIEDGVYPADAAHLAPIHEQVKALERLIDDLRTLALADAGSLTLDRQPTDLAALIDDSLAAFRPTTKAVLRADVEADLPPVIVDAARIRQVLANLLANAVRHVAADGRVTVSARRDGAWLLIEVADNGAGIRADILPHVFERFTREPGSAGSGLGLAIARDLVQAHGGSISVDSEPGRGHAVLRWRARLCVMTGPPALAWCRAFTTIEAIGRVTGRVQGDDRSPRSPRDEAQRGDARSTWGDSQISGGRAHAAALAPP
jgi:signal transduction histidine kinase